MRHRIQGWLTDLVGSLLIIGAVLLGWVPGPGGIPLLLAGLGLLAINHTWARRWLKVVKEKGLNMLDVVFINHPVWKAAYDIVSIAFVTAGVYILNTRTNNLFLSVAIVLIFTGIGLFLGNRKRLKRLTNKLLNRK